MLGIPNMLTSNLLCNAGYTLFMILAHFSLITWRNAEAQEPRSMLATSSSALLSCSHSYKSSMCRVLGNPGPGEVAQQAISKLGGPPDFLGGNVEAEAAAESARMKEREKSGPASPSVSLAAKQDILEQNSMAGDNDWGYASACRCFVAHACTHLQIARGQATWQTLQHVGHPSTINMADGA